MLSSSFFNNNNVSTEDMMRCASQSYVLGCSLCDICSNYHACVGIAMKKCVQRLKENTK